MAAQRPYELARFFEKRLFRLYVAEFGLDRSLAALSARRCINSRSLRVLAFLSAGDAAVQVREAADLATINLSLFPGMVSPIDF